MPTPQTPHIRPPRSRPRRVTTALVALVVLLAVGLTAVADAQAFETRQVDRLLDAWQMDEAKQAIDAMATASPESADVLYLQARYDFLQGDYDRAVARMDQALVNGGERPDWRHLREIIASTAKVTDDYVKHTTPDGRFEIFIEKGKDAVLVPFAAETLDRAYQAIGEELGYYPPTPIRVEVYPTTETLASVSSLTVEDIRTSGTIALCKYNRLMITSPKALLRGYGWADTLVHEYVHYVINRKTHNRVPIWMHEGLAKFLERRWRGADAHRLPPSSEHLLQKRVAANDLITFDEMHPSMAKLPSQEDAAVAFAEVYTVMEYLRDEKGPGAFKTLLDHIESGLDAKTAYQETVGLPFATFESKWKRALRKRPPVGFPDESGYEDKLLFKEDNAKKSELNEIPQPAARDHMHLGELLQVRGRYAAALVEYQKAVRLLGHPNPVLQTRLARCLRETGQPAEALAALREVHALYPGYVTGWLEAGKAALAAGEFDQAVEYLEEAARINPFDPEVHLGLAAAYDKLGDAGRATTARRLARLVQ